jgi:hypothetical protein
MKKSKVIDIFDLGKNSFNINFTQLKNYKKILKFYSEHIETYITSIKQYNGLLKNIKNEIKKNETIDSSFQILQKFDNLLNLQCSFFDFFLEKSENVIKELKLSINNILSFVSDYLSQSQKLSIKIKNTSENYFEKYERLINYLEEVEILLVDNYIKNTYNIDLKRGKDNIEFSDNVIKEAHIYENDFLQTKSDLQNNVKKFVAEYNNKLGEIKIKMKKFNEDSDNGLLKIIQIIKDNCDNLLVLSNNASTNINNINNNINDKEKEYFTYEVKEEDLLKSFKTNDYNIKILEPKERNSIETKIFNDKNNRKKKSIVITAGDIYNIVSKLYEYKFDTINKDGFDLDLEKKKIETIDKANKILGYNFDLHIFIKTEKMSENELNEYIDFIFTKEIYLLKFLECLNNYRSTGRYEISNDLFEILKRIFDKAADYLIDHNTNKDLYNLLIILSQTFYIQKGGEKYFLQKELKKKEFFRSVKFWTDHLQEIIDEELANFENDIKKNKLIISDQKRQKKIEELLFTKIISLIASLNGFELEKEKVDEIILPIIKKYNLSDEVKESILSLIEARK